MRRVFSNIDDPRGEQEILPLDALERAFNRTKLFQGQGLYLRRIGGNGIGDLPEFGTGDPLHRLKTVRLLKPRQRFSAGLPKLFPGLKEIHGLGRSL